ncbi:MAG: serine/threonine protein kinase, partial [Planctomycetota bacterium]|nr:serine/threonine protein kinase [Planctomycetota bacterium]
MQIGPYRVLSEVARGPIGVTYRAQDLSVGRRVVVRVLGRPVSAAERTRLQREARALVELRHPALVAVRSLGE